MDLQDVKRTGLEPIVDKLKECCDVRFEEEDSTVKGVLSIVMPDSRRFMSRCRIDADDDCEKLRELHSEKMFQNLAARLDAEDYQPFDVE